MIARLISIALLLLSASAIASETTTTPQTTQSVIATQEHSIGESAAQWGLTLKEWNDYAQIMRTRRGVWSPGLDPITALGVSADTTVQRKHYAELYVRTEFERTRKELAFQLAVDSAWSRLYPQTPRIGSKAVAEMHGARRYALIVTPNCDDCTDVLRRRLASMISEAVEGIDVHVVGTGGDDNVLRNWIATQPDLLVALKAGRATVNHGDQFQDLSQFPAIYSKTGSGQWTREL